MISQRIAQILVFTRALAAALLADVFCSAASAQTVFSEGFNNVGPVPAGEHGPANLIAAGWTFRNQSQALNYGDWQQNSPSSGIPPQEGTGFIKVEAIVAQANTRFSSWAILPETPGVSAGDTIRLFVNGYGTSPPFNDAENPRIQLRYSPSGGTNTGSTWSDVGDFTTLLGQAGPRLYVWQEIEAQSPGTGRFALRWYKPTPFMMGGYPYAYVDSLTITAEPLGPPIPAPGQTVHWAAERSPIVIDADTVIPAGATLVVDGGVTVHILDNKDFHIAGRLEAAGTPSAHVTFTGENNHAQMALIGGDLEARYTDFHVQLGADIGQFNNTGVHPGAAIFTDCTFNGNAWYHLYASYNSMERCTFDVTYGPIIACIARLIDVTSNQTMDLQGSTSVFRNVTVTGAAGQSELDGSGFLFTGGFQSAFLDGLNAINNAGAGIYAGGGNSLLGPNNTIQGNAVALELGGGLLPGSIVPLTGNDDNGFISVGYSTRPQFGTYNRVGHFWHDIGIPYYVGANWDVIPGSNRFTIQAGVNVLLDDNAIITTDISGSIFIEGRPGNPVTLAALNPATPWFGTAFATEGSRVTDCDLSGAQRGIATFLGLHMDVLNSQIHDNQHGGVRGIRARKTAFRNNTVAGVSNIGSSLGSAVPNLFSATNPNIIENNYYGVIDYYSGSLGTINARNNWWGHPSGANAPDNPGGQGDAAFGSVTTVPFLTAPPDESDHPPVVELSTPRYLEPLSKVTLFWTASDDNRIVSQRVSYRLGSDFDSGFTTVAELSPERRSFEWTVPEVGFTQAGPYTFIRVTAVDDAGQEGYAQLREYIPDQVRQGYFTITPDFTGVTFRPQQIIPAQFMWGLFDELLNGGSGNVVIELMNDDHSLTGSAFYLPPNPLSELRAPNVSTDQVRLVVIKNQTYNRAKFFFSEPFAIRPDPRLGDAPPAITLTSPAPGATLTAGSPVNVSWSATDDNGVRFAKLYASFNGGRTWTRLATDLPAPNGTYTWQLAPGEGFTDVRLKAVAVDTRFQNTSHIISLAIAPGQGLLSGDMNCDGVVSVSDISGFVLALTDPAAFAAAFSGCNVFNADINADGAVTVSDIGPFVQTLTGT